MALDTIPITPDTIPNATDAGGPIVALIDGSGFGVTALILFVLFAAYTIGRELRA